ncbi:MAG: cytochrome C oxidase subunit IV family protein [Ilyomonas sp.]
MEHMPVSAVTAHDQHGATKEIKRVTIILTVLTLVELALGYSMVGMSEQSLIRHFIKGAILILMLAKAFYIIAYFMHLKHELTNMIMTVAIPMLLFVWFIIAFLYEGHSFNNLRNTYDPYYKQSTTQKVAPAEGSHENHEQPKKME